MLDSGVNCQVSRGSTMDGRGDALQALIEVDSGGQLVLGVELL